MANGSGSFSSFTGVSMTHGIPGREPSVNGGFCPGRGGRLWFGRGNCGLFHDDRLLADWVEASGVDALSDTATDRRLETARTGPSGPIGLSVVVPVFNEA